MATILHLITGLEIGGAQRILSLLATRTDRSRFTSVVVSMTEGGAIGPILLNAGIPVEILRMRRGVADPRALTRFVRILRERRPDVLQTWLYHADMLGLIARRPGCARNLLWNIRCSEATGSGAVRLVLSWFSAIPDGVVVNSIAGRRSHQRLGYHPRRWVHIPNGFDTHELRPDPEARSRLRAELELDKAAVAIGLAARYHPVKDHGNFLAAAALLAESRPELRFVMIGEGIEPSNRALMKAIGVHGLTGRVLLLGVRDDIRAVYPALDIATLSSDFGEGFPNVLGEAMSCGVPCVATNSGDTAEILGPTGVVVPPRDPAALAAGWDRLVALGVDRRRAVGVEARERIVREFELGRMIGRYEALYDEITRHSPDVGGSGGHGLPLRLNNNETRAKLASEAADPAEFPLS
jgi:glycosyltransferase involved in cell wall biosynthesis